MGPSADGMLMRSSRPRSGSSLWSGGFALPSCEWQEEQEMALCVGPRPSLPSVLAGAVTQFWVKKLSPISKTRRTSLGRLRAESSNALLPSANAVVSPPSSGS